MPEGLKLGITVVDNATGPLGTIEKNLRKMAQVGERDVRQLNRSFEQLSGGIKSVVIPALNAFGVTSLSVSGIVGGLSAVLLSLSKRTEDINRLSEASKISVARLSDLG